VTHLRKKMLEELQRRNYSGFMRQTELVLLRNAIKEAPVPSDA
jgi:hypothetical protein